MIYAIIEDKLCINTIVAEPDYAAEIGAVELPEGYGIGDSFDGETWTKAPVPEPPVPQPDVMQLINIILGVTE